MTIRILIVDDHAVVRSGLQMILSPEENIEIVGEAENGRQAELEVAKLSPDIVLMDIGLPDMSGIDATARIKKTSPETNVIALTIHEDQEYFFNMLLAGASGYVPKRAAPEELIGAIQTVYDGGVYLYPSLAKMLVKDFLINPETKSSNIIQNLTPRESELLTYLAEGKTNGEIALDLCISPKTVSRHRENIMKKLNIHTRTELVKFAIRKGIVKP